MLTNWRYSTVTSQATTDAGAGTPLLTTGIKPRLVTLLACYWGTNTTSSINMRWFIVPETSISPTSSGQYTLDELLKLITVGHVTRDRNRATRPSAAGGIDFLDYRFTDRRLAR